MRLMPPKIVFVVILRKFRIMVVLMSQMSRTNRCNLPPTKNQKASKMRTLLRGIWKVTVGLSRSELVSRFEIHIMTRFLTWVAKRVEALSLRISCEKKWMGSTTLIKVQNYLNQMMTINLDNQ